ncbi:class I SAM-dependent methyltransferase [Rhodobacterales bacterium]|nr:class I SAM-dependent methyltransferase [Rhodobacterales bacterium]
MSACLADPEYGYYQTRDPFGVKGDFITAPDISQMFGELIGASCLTAFEGLDAAQPFQLAELGPGRGTLMADLLRTATLRPAFLEAARLNLVETSERLRSVQKKTLKNAPLAPEFRNTFEEVPDGPLILFANEFFDALPIHQFVKTPDGWRERQVGLDTAGELVFGAGAAKLPAGAVPPDFENCPAGTIIETQPAANAIAAAIGARLATHGGVALFIDYGYVRTAPGDTLQALYKHTYDDVLAHPGEADLTAHVNFEALAAAAVGAGARTCPPLTQGDFLLRLGLLERAGALGAGKSAREQDAIRDVVERLAAPEQMGGLFKVLAITGPRDRIAPFDTPG